MPHRNCTILEQAFVGMIASAMEVYKKESFGFLIGEVHRKHYLVVDSYTFQSAKRTYRGVDVKRQRIDRVDDAVKFFTKSRVVGDFHSHPEGPDRLSDWDVGEIMDGITNFAVLISLYKRKRQQKWKRNPDLSISGSIGKEYFVRIFAFEADKKAKLIHPIKIVCPYIRKINDLKLYAKKVR